MIHTFCMNSDYVRCVKYVTLKRNYVTDFVLKLFNFVM